MGKNDWDRKADQIDRAVSKLAASIFTGTKTTCENALYVNAQDFAMGLGELGRISAHCRGYAESYRRADAGAGIDEPEPFFTNSFTP
jgi:hypothetical protein